MLSASFRGSRHHLNGALKGFSAINPHLYTMNQVMWKSDLPKAAVLDEEDKDKPDGAPSLDDKTSKPFMWNLGLPELVPDWKRMFHKDTLMTDISAGVTIGCIAVPLSLAIAVASGVPAEVGLVTAAVSGIAGSLAGGTTLAVTGPAAAISLLVISAVQEHGVEALPFITLVCGGMQLASGVTRLGVAAKLVPISVIAGFTTGVGTMILTGQIPKALGMVAPAGMNPIETIQFLGENIGSANPSAAALAAGTAAGMYFLPKIHPKIPAALIAVGGATAATHTMGLDVALIGSIPSGLEAFQFGIPAIPDLGSLPSLAAITFLIYAMTSAESLLSCAALEKMKKTPYKHDPDQELIGQGLANVASGVFMGMPVTSVIARSSLNVRLNGGTRLPGLIQAGFVFGSVVFFSDSISTIPMPALSGMLIMTGAGMLNPAEFKHCYAVQKSDTIPFVATIAGMLAFGLAEGIGVGCLSALMLSHDYGRLVVRHVELPLKVPDPAHEAQEAFQLEGPINFPSMFKIDDLMNFIKNQPPVPEGETAEPVVLDMKGVNSVEFTGVEELVNRLLEVADMNGAKIVMWNCDDELQNALSQCDTNQRIVTHNVKESDEAPFDFPQLPKLPYRAPVPYWYDSPNFRPDSVVDTWSK